ncbi:MAG: OB-fold nucleic acid binding domain-containing protein, partial [Pirellulales bacterium]
MRPMTADPPPPTSDTPGMHEAARREKLRRIRELGHDPWGGRFDGHEAISVLRARAGEVRYRTQQGQLVALPDASVLENPEKPFDFRAWIAEQGAGEMVGPKVRAAGRIVLARDTGKLKFIDIRDWTGRIQLFVGKAQVGPENWELAGCFDLGDLVGVDGELRRTKLGELTIFAEKLHFLTKAIEPPPDKYHGLGDAELRQRRRYVDLAYNEGVLPRFLKRTKIVQSIRRTLASEGFVEIEGPTLHSIAGGAAAKPFITR